MAVRTKAELFQRMTAMIRSGGQGGKTKASDLRAFITDLIDTIFSLFSGSAAVGGILEYDPSVIYDFENNPFCEYNYRIFKTKIDGQMGNEPPFSTNEEGDYENDYWIEVSPAPESGIAEWEAGVYTGDLVIVYYNNKLYRLDVPEAQMPFESVDIVAEIGDEKWVAISGDGGAPSALETAYFSFNSNLDVVDQIMFSNKILISLPETKSSNITSFSYEVRLDSATTWTTKATGAELQTWINTLSSGVPYWIKVIVDPAENAGNMSVQFKFTGS